MINDRGNLEMIVVRKFRDNTREEYGQHHQYISVGRPPTGGLANTEYGIRINESISEVSFFQRLYCSIQ